MINDIYNSSISTYQHIQHSNYDICEWNLNMFCSVFGWAYGTFLGWILVNLRDEYKKLKAYK